MPANEQEEFEFRLRAEQEAARAAPPPPAAPSPEVGSRARARETAPSLLGSARRGALFTSGNIGEGIAATLGLPVDTVQNVLDLLKAGAGTAYGTATGKTPPEALEPADRSKVLGSGQQISEFMHRLGIISPEAAPETALGRVGAGAIQAMPSVLAGGRVSPGQALRGVAGAAGGGAAQATAQEAGLPPSAQVTASMLPALGRAGLAYPQEKARQAIVGQTDVRGNIAADKRAGIPNPSPGAVTGNKTLAGFESMVGRLPGGGAPMERAAEGRAGGMQARVGEIARGLAPGGPVGAERAGRAIEAGVEGAVTQFRGAQKALYDKVDTLVPPTRPIPLKNFFGKVQELGTPIPNAEALSKHFIPAKITALRADLEETLTSNTTAGTIPYQAASQLRTQIGRMLEDNLLLTDVPKAQYKALYKALTEDIRSGLPPAARQAWDRASRYTRAGHDRIETVYQPLADKNTPEKALKAALSGTREGSSAFRKIMGALTPAQRNVVAAHVVENMGKAAPSQQTAAGDKFSVETFLTSWNKMDAGARRALYPDTRTHKDLQTIAEAAERLRAAGRASYNPSGTAGSLLHVGYGASVLGSVVTLLGSGHPIAAGGALAAAGAEVYASRRMAVALSSPEFLHWLAEGSKAPVADMPRYAARLAVIARGAKDPEQQEVLSDLAAGLGAPVTEGAQSNGDH